MEIIVDNYSKVIRGRNILKNINLRLESGNIYGLKGPNGCGKTMLMRAICGLIIPSSGYVKIDDKIIGKDISFPDSIGLLLENPSFVNEYTGFKNLKLISQIQNIISDEEIIDAISKVGLDYTDKRSFRKYSLGMKQKLGIACAIMDNPQLLILDEPFNALDDKSIGVVKAIIKEFKKNGAIIIISCHDKDILYELSDEVYSIVDGEITGVEKK